MSEIEKKFDTFTKKVFQSEKMEKYMLLTIVIVGVLLVFNQMQISAISSSLGSGGGKTIQKSFFSL